jgi:hypothetical protein
VVVSVLRAVAMYPSLLSSYVVHTLCDNSLFLTVPASSRSSSCCSSLSAAAADFTSHCCLLMGASKSDIMTYKFVFSGKQGIGS